MTVDPVALLQDLIRCPSVTPADAGALDVLEKLLSAHGFTCHRLPFGGDDGTARIDNLYARRGTSAPHLCFAGHTDVVPAADADHWQHHPFAGVIADGYVHGRGAADMKGPLACFVAAALDFITQHNPQGSISFLITGDEEGPALNGTRKVLEWLDARGEKIDFCLVGEPTSRQQLGDMIKIGRRGTITGYLTVKGSQGHVAYPHLADNPIPKMLKILAALDAMALDSGSEHFEPSNLEIVTVDTDNTADNLIPPQLRATFNIRFNDHHSGASLSDKIKATINSVAGITERDYDLRLRINGESFYTPPGREADLLGNAIEAVTGRRPELSTSGGTSDARFIRAYAPVLEFGIVGATMHKTDERVSLDDMAGLYKIYSRFLRDWFA